MSSRNNRAKRIASSSLAQSKRRAERASRWVADGSGAGAAAATFERWRFYRSERIDADTIPMPCDGKPEQLRLF